MFKLQALTDAEQTFVLTGGGHNVGIVNPPGRPKANYRVRAWHAGDRLLTPDEWLAATTVEAGSWWTLWHDWLARHSSGQQATPPPIGAAGDGLTPLDAAPGRYVYGR